MAGICANDHDLSKQPLPISGNYSGHFCLQRWLMRHQTDFLLICHHVFVTMTGSNWLGLSPLVVALDAMGYLKITVGVWKSTAHI